MGLTRDIDCLNDQINTLGTLLLKGENLERQHLSAYIMQRAIQFAIAMDQVENITSTSPTFVLF